MSAAVEVKHLGYSAGRTRLLSDVDLAVSGGELVAIIGPNGAGKSTMLRLIAGDIEPATGIALVEGLPASSDDRAALRRAVLAQGGVSDVPFTSREVVAMGRHPHRRDPSNSSGADAAAIAEAMASTDTSHLAERVFATLSGGEQARVSLARIFAQATPVLILDEPTSGLDVAHEERVMGELTRRARRGAAILAVLHDLNVAARYATRIVAMMEGTITADGPPRTVLTEPLLTRLYGYPMHVVDHPFRDCPLVLTSDE